LGRDSKFEERRNLRAGVVGDEPDGGVVAEVMMLNTSAQRVRGKEAGETYVVSAPVDTTSRMI
jgi:hypothetical protein